MKFIFSLLIICFCLNSFATEPPVYVVIFHGFAGPTFIHSPLLSPVTDELKKANFKVLIADTPKVATFETHTMHGTQFILDNVPLGARVILLGHSQGGIVVRSIAHFMNHFQSNYDILVVSSIGTPHRGAHNGSFAGMGEYLQRVPSKILKKFSTFMKASQQMSDGYMQKFNENIINIPGVRYVSVVTETPSKAGTAANDGVVPVRSALWGYTAYADGSTRPINDHLNPTPEAELYRAGHLEQIHSMPFNKKTQPVSRRIGKHLAGYFQEVVTLAKNSSCQRVFW